MTEQEINEAAKSWRLSVHFLFWVFIVYGNWKRRIIFTGWNKAYFEIYDFHPFRAELNYDEKVRAGLVEKPEWWNEVEKIKNNA